MTPRNVQIQTTSICNGHCTICPYHGSEVARTAKVMDDYIFYDIIDSLKGVRIKKLAMYMQAEPFTDELVLGRVLWAMQHVEADMAELSTNCLLLNNDLIDKIVNVAKKVRLETWLSFHGQAITGFDDDIILKHLTNALKRFDDNHIKCSIVSSPNTQAKRDYFTSMFKALGLKTHPRVILPKLVNRGGLLPHIATVNRNTYKCSRHTDWLHFDVDGNVVMCCDDYERKVKFGNIKDDKLENIVSHIEEKVSVMSLDPNFMCWHCSSPGDVS